MPLGFTPLRLASAGVVLFSTALGSCGSREQPSDRAAVERAPGRAAVDADLRGRSYVAVGAKTHELVQGVKVSIGFEDKTVNTFGGCNGTGGYFYAADNGVLRLTGEASSTLMGCGPDRDRQEEWWNTFLLQSPKITVRDGGEHLQLSTQNETVALVSTRRPHGRRVVPYEKIEQFKRDVVAWNIQLQVEKDKLRDQVEKGNLTAAQGRARKEGLQTAHDDKVDKANPYADAP